MHKGVKNKEVGLCSTPHIGTALHAPNYQISKEQLMAKENDDNRLKSIKNAQDRKDFAIAYFNATNNAIEILKDNLNIDIQKYDGYYNQDAFEQKKKAIAYWRDWFLEEHLKYRALVTEKIGATYNPKDAIGKLEATTTLEQLETVWLSFTQDERLDTEIAKKCQELKTKYETIQRD